MMRMLMVVAEPELGASECRPGKIYQSVGKRSEPSDDCQVVELRTRELKP